MGKTIRYSKEVSENKAMQKEKIGFNKPINRQLVSSLSLMLASKLHKKGAR